VGNHWRDAVRWLHSKGNPILFGGLVVLAVGGTITYFIIRYRMRTNKTP